MSLELSAIKRFRLKVEQWENRQVALWYDSLIYELDIWQEEVQTALSVPLPDKPNAVTTDRSRLFPYMRKGKLHSAFHKASMYAHTTEKGNKMVSAKVKVDNVGGLNTTFGLKAPKTASIGAWVAWYDDIFSGTGRGNVEKSLKQIFKESAKKRARFYK